MKKPVRVASLADIAPGSCKEVFAAGRIVALFNVAGAVYALDGVCPHQGGPLGQGTLEHNVVTCPWHGWQFGVTTGRHQLNPQICQEKLEVRIEGDDVMILLDSPEPT